MEIRGVHQQTLRLCISNIATFENSPELNVKKKTKQCRYNTKRNFIVKTHIQGKSGESVNVRRFKSTVEKSAKHSKPQSLANLALLNIKHSSTTNLETWCNYISMFLAYRS